MFIKESKKHLQENKMNYWQHFCFAASHGFCCIKAGIFLLVHSLVPALFQRAGSIIVRRLNKSFTDHNIHKR